MPSPPGAPARRSPAAGASRSTRSGNARSSASIGRVPGVGHGGVHAAHARALDPAALPAGDGLVVHPRPAVDVGAADQQVVHRPLRRGAEPAGHDLGQRTEAHVGHPLADLDVAGAHRRRRQGVDDRARRGEHRHRPQRAAVGRQRRGRARTAARRPTALTVTASTALTLPVRCGSVPVKSNVIVVAVDGELDPRRGSRPAARARGPKRVDHVGERPRAVGQVASSGRRIRRSP